MAKTSKIYPDNNPFHSRDSAVPLLKKSKTRSPLKKHSELIVPPNVVYKHIHTQEPLEKHYEDCYLQLFSHSLSTSLRRTITESQLINPKAHIFKDREHKFRQMKEILSNFKRTPCFSANRDQSEMTLLVHTDVVYVLEISHDQKYMLSGSGDKSIIRWDLSSNLVVQKYPNNNNNNNEVFSLKKKGIDDDDDETITKQKPDNSKTNYAIRTSNSTLENRGPGHTDAIYDIKITKDDRYFLSGSGDKTIRVWDVISGDVLGVLKGHKAPIFSLVLIEETKRVISGSGDKTIWVWDYVRHLPLMKLKGHNDIVRPMAITSDMKKLISGGYDNNIIVWDLEELEENKLVSIQESPLPKKVKKIKIEDLQRAAKIKAHKQSLKALLITPDSKSVISSSLDFSIKIWNIESMKKDHGEFIEIESNNVTAYSLVISPEYPSLLFTGGWDRIIRVWDLNSRKLIKTLEGHTDALRSFAVCKDRLISGAADKSIRIWNFLDKHERVLLEGHCTPVRALAISNDKKHLFSAGEGKTIKVWDLGTHEETGEEIGKVNGHSAAIRVLVVTFDSLKLISGSVDKSIKVWEVSTKALLTTFVGHTGAINALVVTEDGRNVISGANDNTIRIWDLEMKKKEAIVLEGHTNTLRALVLTPDNSQVISGGWDKTIRIWSLQNFKPIVSFQAHNEAVLVLAISPHGKILVSGSFDKSIKVWNLETREERGTLIGHSGTIRSLVISTDSSTIFSGGFDKTIRMWDIETCCQIGVLVGHTSTIYSIILTPDSTSLISASWDQTIRLWTLEYKEKIEALHGHTDAVRSLAISPDASKIVCGSADNSIRVWDVNTKMQTAILWGHTSIVYSLLVTSDSARIISGSGDKSIIVWDIESKTPIKRLQKHTDAVWVLAFTPDGTKLVSAGADKTVKVWNYESEKYLGQMVGHKGTVYSLAITKDSRRVISGGRDQDIIIWDIETKQPLETLRSDTGTVYSLVITNDNKLITGNYNKTIMIWDLEKKQQSLFAEGKSIFRSLVITNDGTKIISGSGDCYIKIWDLERKMMIRKLKGHTGAVRALTLNPDCSMIISGSYDNSMRVWDLETGESNAHMEVQGSSYSILMTPDRNNVVSASYEKEIKIWDIQSKKQTTLSGHTNVIRTIVFSADSKLIVSGSADKSIIIWDLEKKQSIATLNGHEDIVYCLALSVDGIRLFSGSYDNSIKIWDLETQKEISTFRQHKGAVNALLLLSDQDTLISASTDRTIRVWSVKLKKHINKLTGHSELVKILAVTPNEHYLISGGADKTLRLWSIKDLRQVKKPKEIACLLGHNTTVRTIVVTPDSRKIISASVDNSIRVWDIDAKISLFSIESNIPLQTQPFISKERGRVIALLGHVIYDFQNEIPLFTVADHESLSGLLFSEKTKSLICIDKNDDLIEKSFQNITSFSKGFSLINIIFEENSVEKLDLNIRKLPLLLPFYYNFLHIVALFDNQLPFQIKGLEFLNVPIDCFLQLDFLNQTCIDIAIDLNLKSLVKILLERLINALCDPNTSFYHKMRLYGYEFNEEQRKDRNFPIFQLFSKLLAIFDTETTLLSQLIELSYVDIDVACFFNNLSSDELKNPLFLIINKVSDLKTEEALKGVLDFDNSWGVFQKAIIGGSQKKQAYVKCRIFLLKGFTEINSESKALFKKIMTYSPSNLLYSNRVFQMFIRYKWDTYARGYMLQEFFGFVLIFLVYLANYIYILPARNSILNEKFGSSKYDTISLAFEITLLTYFTYYSYKELIQMKKSGLSSYFSSPWNWLDIILVPLILFNSSFDIYQIFQEQSNIVNEKIVSSVTFLIFWMRVLSYSRAFEGTGFMIRLVIQVIFDMKYFLLLIILFTLAFGTAGFMLQTNFEVGQWRCFTAFYRLMLGDFTLYDSDLMDVDNDIIIWIIMILFTLLLSVIMLNLLISIIGETFAKVRSAESSMKYYELYSIINEIDASLGANTVNRMRKEGKIGNYLVCLYNEDSHFAHEERSHNELVEKTRKIEKEVLRVSEEMSILNREIKDFRKQVYEDMSEIKVFLLNERKKILKNE